MLTNDEDACCSRRLASSGIETAVYRCIVCRSFFAFCRGHVGRFELVRPCTFALLPVS